LFEKSVFREIYSLRVIFRLPLTVAVVKRSLTTLKTKITRRIRYAKPGWIILLFWVPSIKKKPKWNA